MNLKFNKMFNNKLSKFNIIYFEIFDFFWSVNTSKMENKVNLPENFFQIISIMFNIKFKNIYSILVFQVI